jgi:hypothetical protein
MKSPERKEQQGIVAILDALGASSYSNAEIERFLNARALIIEALNSKADVELGEIRPQMLVTFTFNDTIVIVLKSGNGGPTKRHVQAFYALLRKFMIDSLSHSILFRGAISVGTFYLEDETNTVMGQAVTDAAAWYDKADWFGVHATPRTSLLIERLIGKRSEHIIVEYPVPMKVRSPLRLKAVNWPKGFYVPSVLGRTLGLGAQRPTLLSLLSTNQIPRGVESKYTNAISFFRRYRGSTRLRKAL